MTGQRLASALGLVVVRGAHPIDRQLGHGVLPSHIVRSLLEPASVVTAIGPVRGTAPAASRVPSGPRPQAGRHTGRAADAAETD